LNQFLNRLFRVVAFLFRTRVRAAVSTLVLLGLLNGVAPNVAQGLVRFVMLLLLTGFNAVWNAVGPYVIIVAIFVAAYKILLKGIFGGGGGKKR
jgi:hypothetical protein